MHCESQPKAVARLRRYVPIVVSAVAAFGCNPAQQEQPPIPISEPAGVLTSPPRGDSAWAVIVAYGRYTGRVPGISARVSGYRREGETHYVSFAPVGFFLGGAATIRVEPDGTSQITELQQ